MDSIYLDNNATTPMLPEVASAIADCHARLYANPASQHQSGRRSRQVLDEAREGIAEILGAHLGGKCGDRLVFTSGGTESNNLAIRGLNGSRAGQIVISPVEHPSISATANECARQGCPVSRLTVDKNGRVDPVQLDEFLSRTTRLVSVTAANHETGVLQPLPEIAARCHTAGVPLHTDAVQRVGKLPTDFGRLGVAALSVSGHKFHGPVGIGALLLRHDVKLLPLVHGGSQQLRLRPGTEPVALAVGMFRALQVWQQNAEQHLDRVTRLRDRLEAALVREIPELVINGSGALRLPQTSNMAFPGLDRQAVVMALDLAGIACSTGSACASGSRQPSATLQAMQSSQSIIDGSVRFSLSGLSTEAEIDEAATRIVKVFKKLRSIAPARKTASPPPHEPPESL